MKTRETLKRREFLRQATQVATAVVVSAGIAPAAAPADRNQDSADFIPTTSLGKTGLKLPVLGYGGAALPKAWFNPLSREQRVELVRYAYDMGIRYFDTAGASYMESQAILGEALKDRRQQVCLVTKVDTTVPGEVRQSVEQSLKELQTDYLDILLIHGTPGLQQMTIEQAMKIHSELVKLCDEPDHSLHRVLGAWLLRQGACPDHVGGL